MSVSITFYRVSEKIPEHGQDVIWLQPSSSFGYESFLPRQIEIEYQWTLLDDNGDYSGGAVCFESMSDFKHNDPSVKLDILFDSCAADVDCPTNNFLWIDVEEYWKCFDREVR